jgi:hypothetical protein
MTRTVKMEISKKDYNRIMVIVDNYTKGKISVISKANHNEVEFNCNIFRLNKLIHDVELTKELGFEVEMEIC